MRPRTIGTLRGYDNYAGEYVISSIASASYTVTDDSQRFKASVRNGSIV